jgi:NADPH:quinone reductase-like Zn-dependent oxidoreductase
VGGDYPAQAVTVLKQGGILASTQPPTLAALAESAAERGIRLAGIIVEADGSGMFALADLAAAGKLVPTIAATFPLEEARTASGMTDLASDGKVFPLQQGGPAESGEHGPGKIVLIVS